MDENEIAGALMFLREAERLKTVLRSGRTSSGRPESTAEHTWRLCLMALVFAPHLGEMDVMKLLKICVVHDLGEALGGDVRSQVTRPMKKIRRMSLRWPGDSSRKNSDSEDKKSGSGVTPGRSMSSCPQYQL